MARWCLIAGLATVAVALSPPVDARADATLAAHMVQHVVMTMVAAPLLAAGLGSVWFARLKLPRVNPLLAWLLFAATGWLVHFTPLFQTATESLPVHMFEHAVLLGSGFAFWAQVVGPAATMSYPLRLLYLLVAMPQNTFVALAIFSTSRVLYPHYGSGPDALADQRLGGGIMWVAGDLVLLAAVLVMAAGWARQEERETRLNEEAADQLPSPRTGG
ncbi:MAG: cytochrome c oxidase assembly protein [Actinomycetota bacterium]|nr:cytochrome c oxidase assembly protein [Actinomycetota bacterium]